MIDPKKIEQIARQVHESMPKGIREFGEDIEKKIRQTLQSQLTRLDLVSREEFDVQTQVLLRTRKNWRCWSNASANWKLATSLKK